MAGHVLIIDDLSLRHFGRDLRNFEKYARPATAALINKLCYNIRQETLHTITEHMVIRNLRFVAGRLRYQKATPQLPVGRQFGLVGAWADRPRFGGWARQVGGAEAPRQGGKRTLTIEARGGDEASQVKPRFRMKASSHFVSWKDMRGGNSPEQKQHILIRRVFQEKFTQPFVLGHPKPPGLYRRVGNRLVMLQSFKPDRRRVKKFDWRAIGVQRGLAKVNLENEWYKACRYAMSKVKTK